MKTKTINMMGVFLFISSIAIGQGIGYNDYDGNMDGSIDLGEFNNQYNDTYSGWDQNNDTYVDETEFYDNTYRNIDQDRDNQISEDEWNHGYESMYGDYVDSEGFNDYDANRDGYLNTEEYQESFMDSDYYSSYDSNQDGNVDQNELNEGVYRNMDRNQDRSLDQNEYDAYGTYYNTVGDM